MTWMIYGANGYTGRLIAAQAQHTGFDPKPTLAGRDPAAISTLADNHGSPYAVFQLTDPAEIDRAMRGCSLLLNCAGPFSATVRPLLEACIRNGVHYLDITGEIEVFEYAQSRNPDAQQAGIAVCPGAGFDVVPTDCLALRLSMLMPDANTLRLGFDTRSGPSQGTAKTSVEGLGKGCMIRSDGVIRNVPLAYRIRRINFSGDREKCAMTIPWGDVSTAWYTTGIPNIETYIAVSPRMANRARRLSFLRPIITLAPVQHWLKKRIEKKIAGPDAERRAATPTYVWGEVENASGNIIGARIKVANGYDVTVNAALGIVRRLLDDPPPGGTYTPSQIMGWEYITKLPGSGEITTH